MLRAVTFVATVGLLVGCLVEPVGASDEYGLEVVASGLSAPVGVRVLPGDERLFVVEKAGRIRTVVDREVSGTFLDIREQVSSTGEQGLLGLAFHPDFATNRRLYINYTDTGGTTRVVEYRANASATAVLEGTARTLLSIPQPATNHNGGHLEFGPDGYLYVASGDGGGSTGYLNGQDTTSLLGGILRIDVDTGGAAPTNAFVDRPGADALWAYGLRNPWRFTIDDATGNVIIGDVGQSSYEEIDLANVAEAGVNFGWARLEGNVCYRPSSGCSTPGARPPIEVYSHAEGSSVTGGVVYRGSGLPGYDGHYFYGDWGSGFVRSFRLVDGRVTDRTDWTKRIGPVARIVSFGIGTDGELLLVSLSGTIWRLNGPSAPVGRVERLDAVSDGVAVVGWTFDPTVPSLSIPVHVYVGGRFAGGFGADGRRADVNRVFGIEGDHGYRAVVSAGPGDEVCVFGINDGRVALGGHARLGCMTVPEN